MHNGDRAIFRRNPFLEFEGGPLKIEWLANLASVWKFYEINFSGPVASRSKQCLPQRSLNKETL